MQAQAISRATAICEAADTLSQMDVILPSQYFASVGSIGFSSEQRLMLAVLVDAINVLRAWDQVGTGRKRRAFAEAAQWVSKRGTKYPFAFDSVCEALEIDPELVRSRLNCLTIGLANSARLPMGRLRLKELSRTQHMRPNRSPRRRSRRPF
jgi:hypothetical protein